jgi:hypothetical protein
VDSREQVIQDGLNNINSVNLENAINFFTLLASSNCQGPLEIISDNTTSFTLSAAATSLTLLAAAMSFPLSVSNSCKEGLLKAKSKHARKTSSIKFEAKWPKRKREKIARGRVHCVTRSQNPMLFRHERITQGVKTRYIIPDNNVAYSSRAVTYLLELAVVRGRNKVYLTRH